MNQSGAHLLCCTAGMEESSQKNKRKDKKVEKEHSRERQKTARVQR